MFPCCRRGKNRPKPSRSHQQSPEGSKVLSERYLLLPCHPPTGRFVPRHRFSSRSAARAHSSLRGRCSACGRPLAARPLTPPRGARPGRPSPTAASPRSRARGQAEGPGLARPRTDHTGAGLPAGSGTPWLGSPLRRARSPLRRGPAAPGPAPGPVPAHPELSSRRRPLLRLRLRLRRRRFSRLPERSRPRSRRGERDRGRRAGLREPEPMSPGPASGCGCGSARSEEWYGLWQC